MGACGQNFVHDSQRTNKNKTNHLLKKDVLDIKSFFFCLTCFTHYIFLHFSEHHQTSRVILDQVYNGCFVSFFGGAVLDTHKTLT